MSLPPGDDYYAMLGVSAGADGEMLRRAWRRLAVRWHPDRAGHGATARFQELSAAYEVLSDPLKRAAYDRRRRTATPVSSGANRSAAATGACTAPARERAPGVMLTRLSGPLRSLVACGAVRIGDDNVITLMMSETEAALGGMVTISMHVDLRCPSCAAQQSTATRCARCGGTRAVDELFSAWLAVPPGVKAGEALTPSVELPGMLDPVRFRVQISARRS